MSVLRSCAIALGLLALAGAARADNFHITIEAPGVQSSSITPTIGGVETFDTRATGFHDFTTDFGTGGAITADYTGVQINTADQYGGAGGTGKYAVAFLNTPYTITLNTDIVKDPHGVNFFGFWFPAIDAGNVITFSKGGTVVGTIHAADITSMVAANPAYWGNPTTSFKGQDNWEAFVYVNAIDTNGTFDSITVQECGCYGGGNETDNHTVGYVSGAPEPAAWAMMIMAVAGIGGVLRRRRIVAAA